MRLALGPGDEREDPNAGEIRSALRSLEGGHDSFAILSRDEQHYLQTAGGGPDGFVLEYREGDAEHHFRCVDRRLPLELVVGAFLSYARGDGPPRSLAWEPAEAPPQSPLSIVLLLVGAVALVALAGYLVARAF